MQKAKRFICLTGLVLLFCSFIANGQKCTCNTFGKELISNGDFSGGNTGFTTSYLIKQQAAPGCLGITKNGHTPNTCCWAHCTDHTNGKGNFMWVDASSSSSIIIWSEKIRNVVPNRKYLFSCWVNTLDPSGPAILQFSVNGHLLDSPFTAPADTGRWVKFCALWSSGPDTIATIAVTNQSKFASGNDIGLDDISFLECNSPKVTNLSPRICSKSKFILPGGRVVYRAGVYTDSFRTFQGADSLVITHLSVNPDFSLQKNLSLCEGSSYKLPGGKIVRTSGTYIDSFKTVSGCDSIITTVLRFSLLLKSQTMTVCEGSFFTLPGGRKVKAEGVYTDSLKSHTGCDSVVITRVQFLSINRKTREVSICQGSYYHLSNGDSVTRAGVYIDTVESSVGCDTIVTIKLKLLPPPLKDSLAIITESCFDAGDASVEIKAKGKNLPFSYFLDNKIESEKGDFHNLSRGWHNYKISDKPGCTSIDSFFLPGSLKDCSCSIYFPTIFTPNGDSVNDIFYPVADCRFRSFDFKVFDRWGELIFTGNSSISGWNGRYKGKRCQSGLYLWILDYSHATHSGTEPVRKVGSFILAD